MANDILERLQARFTNATRDVESPDFLTRDIGGHWRNNQPYISGYFQVMFGLPEALFGDAANAANASKWLHTTCEGFTPHSQTLTKVDVQGQGQIGASFISNIITTREITFTFREYQRMPINQVIKTWGSVFDPFVGISPLQDNEFIPANYKGWVAVAQFRPGVKFNYDENNIEECYIYQGVMPTNIPTDTASAADITTNDTVQHSVTFSFDGHPLTSTEKGVSKYVAAMFKDMSYVDGNDSTFGGILKNGLATKPYSFEENISVIASASVPE